MSLPLTLLCSECCCAGLRAEVEAMVPAALHAIHPLLREPQRAPKHHQQAVLR